jgi:CRISPR/Cas system-associated protein Csx1
VLISHTSCFYLQSYQELLQYKSTHGTTQVPKRHTSLGHWCQRIRREYQAQQSGSNKKSLTPERIKLLESIGFSFAPIFTGRKSGKQNDEAKEEAQQELQDIPKQEEGEGKGEAQDNS